MNIFHHTVSFLGCPDNGVTKDSLLSLFKLAKQIRQRLGKQGYLLDHYLSTIFEGMSNKLPLESADEGSRAEGALYGLLYHVLDGTEPKNPHPLYLKIKEIYEQYADKLNFQENYTNLSMPMIILADELMIHASEKFVKELNNMGGTVDIIRLQEVYEQISHLAGESMMEELNQQIKQRFIFAPTAALFAQGFTAELLSTLSYRDIETSKQMFQLLLEIISSDLEEV